MLSIDTGEYYSSPSTPSSSSPNHTIEFSPSYDIQVLSPLKSDYNFKKHMPSWCNNEKPNTRQSGIFRDDYYKYLYNIIECKIESALVIEQERLNINKLDNKTKHLIIYNCLKLNISEVPYLFNIEKVLRKYNYDESFIQSETS